MRSQHNQVLTEKFELIERAVTMEFSICSPFHQPQYLWCIAKNVEPTVITHHTMMSYVHALTVHKLHSYIKSPLLMWGWDYLRLMSVEYKLQDLSQGQLVSGANRGLVHKHTVVGECILQLRAS